MCPHCVPVITDVLCLDLVWQRDSSAFSPFQCSVSVSSLELHEKCNGGLNVIMFCGECYASSGTDTDFQTSKSFIDVLLSQEFNNFTGSTQTGIV